MPTLESHFRTRSLQNDGGQYAIATAILELVNLIKSEIDKSNNLEVEREQIKKDMESLLERGKPDFGGCA